LGLVGEQFNTCISVLFAGYIALQIPSNLILTRVRPSIYLPTCMALWGVVSGCTAAVKDFHGLVVCRFFLGFLEAPFFPGALFLLSSWYTPRELATRTAIMYCGSLLSSAFGGLVGAGVQYGLNGAHGLHSWQWLFVIEGAVTVTFSLISLVILPDFPATTRWLSDEEKAVAVHRLRVHSGSVDEERGPLFRGLLMAVSDYKVWLLALIAVLKTSAGAVTSFIPTLVATFGYDRTQSLLMTAPPYVLAAFVSLGVAISSDRREERYFHLVSPLIFGMIGFTIAAATTSLASRYFALFLMLGGVYGSFDITYAWISSTVSTHIFITYRTTNSFSFTFPSAKTIVSMRLVADILLLNSFPVHSKSVLRLLPLPTWWAILHKFTRHTCTMPVFMDHVTSPPWWLTPALWLFALLSRQCYVSVSNARTQNWRLSRRFRVKT
jgi:MFS family permease